MQPNEAAQIQAKEAPHLLGALGPCVGIEPLPLPAQWAERARREVNEDPDATVQNVQALRQRVIEERDLYSRTDDTFLLSFLRARKHDVGEAFKVLKNFYRLRAKYPLYTQNCLPSENGFVFDMNGYTVLAERDQLDRTIVAIRVEDVDLDLVRTEHFFQQLWTTMQLIVQDPYVQVAGIVMVLDLTSFSLRHTTLVTPSFARVAMRFLQDSFPVRLQAIHIVFEPFYFDAIFTLFKPFLKAKLRKRIHLHGSDMRTLTAMLAERVLPEPLGGCAPSWNFEEFRAAVTRNEPLLEEWSRYGYGRTEEGDAATSAP